MSRLGKQPIAIPEKTEVTVGQNGVVTVKGPHGELTRRFRRDIEIGIQDQSLVLTPKSNTRLARALWGTYAAHLSNMVQGVGEPFKKVLSVEGVGFRVEGSGQMLTFHLGFSHPVKVTVPPGLTASVEKNTVTVTGIDREQVGQFAASVRAIKKPEPYKGKGIRYANEVVRRKQGKKTA